MEQSISLLPAPLRNYVLSHTRRNSKTSAQLVELLHRLLSGGRVAYREVKKSGLKYHVDRMRKLGLLIGVKKGRTLYIAVNPELASSPP